MKVLVIGGAGYIGSHAVYELIHDNHEVIIMDNLSTGKKEMIHKKAKFYLGDITKKQELVEILKKEDNIDVVMHFAAKLIVPESLKIPLEYYHNNVEGVRIMLEVMNEFNIKNIVFSSTAAVYGEPVNFVCSEEDITIPVNPYGESKLACEKLIKWASLAHNMNYCIFRYFNVAGADESLEIGLVKDNITHIIPIAIQTALGIRSEMAIFGDDYDTLDGTCIRDYIHVTDLAKAHILGAKYLIQNNKSLLVNLGSNSGYSVKEVIATVEKFLPVNYKIADRRAGDPAKLIASNKLAKKLLNWDPIFNLEDMIKSDMEFRKKIKE